MEWADNKGFATHVNYRYYTNNHQMTSDQMCHVVPSLSCVV